MNRHLRRHARQWILFCIMITLFTPFSAFTVRAEHIRTVVEELVVYYGTYGAEAEQKTSELLYDLHKADPAAEAKWKKIMNLWKTVNTDPEIHEGILPDGLPETDELCLVVLGSGEMAKWLTGNGVDPQRVIVEDRSLTTAQNAIYTYWILTEQYPQVKQLAIVSSDYHIATGTLLFNAEAILQAEDAGKEIMPVVSNAAWHAPSGTLSPMFQAGALIELSGDKETAFEIYYETYDIHELPPLNP